MSWLTQKLNIGDRVAFATVHHPSMETATGGYQVFDMNSYLPGRAGFGGNVADGVVVLREGIITSLSKINDDALGGEEITYDNVNFYVDSEREGVGLDCVLINSVLSTSYLQQGLARVVGFNNYTSDQKRFISKYLFPVKINDSSYINFLTDVARAAGVVSTPPESVNTEKVQQEATANGITFKPLVKALSRVNATGGPTAHGRGWEEMFSGIENGTRAFTSGLNAQLSQQATSVGTVPAEPVEEAYEVTATATETGYGGTPAYGGEAPATRNMLRTVVIISDNGTPSVSTLGDAVNNQQWIHTNYRHVLEEEGVLDEYMAYTAERPRSQGAI